MSLKTSLKGSRGQNTKVKCMLKQESRMGRVSKFSRGNLCMKAILKMVSAMDMGEPFQARAKSTKGSLILTKCTDKGSFSGLTVEYTKESGATMSRKVEASIFGRTGRYMWVNSKKMSATAMEHSTTPTAKLLSATGEKVKNTVKGSFGTPTAHPI